jgi:hypothetical protein
LVQIDCFEKNKERRVNDTNHDEARRTFVKTAGKLAIYAPPAMMLLAKPTAYAASSCNNGGGNGAEGCSPSPNGNNDEN